MNRLIDKLHSLFRRTRQPRTREEFEQLFRSFRAIMDSNTAALEIITEMGDILGGDYLFDIQYVRRALDELDLRLRDSLMHFDGLTGEEHRELKEIYGRINGAVRQVLDGAAPETPELVLSLGTIDGSMAGSVGGKMANLGEVKRSLSLAVPEGFAVTTRGFDAYVRHNRVFEKAGQRGDRRLAAPASWYEGVAEVMLHGELPPELHEALARALGRLRSRCGKDCALAVRSSAGDEDGEHSFAGQFATVLGVPPETDALEKAYRKVIASLFSGQAAAYQERFGYDPLRMKMAVGFLVMVDAASSGVLFTADPAGGRDAMLISSAWGLGTSVVDGRVDADQFAVGRDGRVTSRRIGSKATMSLRRPGGVGETATPGERQAAPSISPPQIAELVRAGGELERHFRGPQDVEWAFDAGGRLFILQSRPLRVVARAEAPSGRPGEAGRISFRNAGIIVQRGVAAGPVHVVRTDRDLDSAPRGAVLAVNHDSPSLVRVMPRIAAIITDTGSLTSHMASLAREFRVPTVVNTGNATKVLSPHGEVTVVLGDEASVVTGRDHAALASAQEQAAQMDDLYEFRRKRYILRHIAPLNLVDPFRDDFSPRGCRTVHDVLRFLHEGATGRLIEAAGFGVRSGGAVKLDLAIPAGITVIDIGGGLRGMNGRGRASMDEISSVPFRALVQGMVHPGAWRSDAVPLSMNNFLASMVHAPDLVAESDRQMGSNVAVISREYVNLNIKFGYHYTILDSYVSETPRSNHVYFRFAGGATDLTKRSRRLQLIERILSEQGFRVNTRGDLLVARLSGLGSAEMAGVLDRVGRLISFTRQLDAVLGAEGDVERYADSFLEGRFEAAGKKSG